MNEFPRMDAFNYYETYTNPFLAITIPIDVTNIFKGKNFNVSFGYVIGKAVNEVKEFKYRYVDGEVKYFSDIEISYTDMLKDNTIGFFDCPIYDSYQKHLESYLKEKENFQKVGHSTNDESKVSVIWVSCTPWFKFSSLVPPFSKGNTIPQFIWDQVIEKDNHYYSNLMILIHHGFADGYHINLLKNKIDELISKFPNI